MEQNKTPLFLAPMAGAGDRAFREICSEFGADMFFTEMISAKAVVFGDKKTEKLAETGNIAVPCRIQLFGHEPEIMAKSAKLLAEKYHPPGFDINMGCPVPKIVKGGDGSALMKTPLVCRDLVDAVISETGLPVSVKMRAGWDSSSLNAAEVASLVEKAGADMIAVHGRTREDLYREGTVRREVIKAVKEKVGIKVIANGDIYSADDALSMLSSTGSDGVMIARGAMGAPWIFEEIRAALEKRNAVLPDKKTVIKKHLLLAKEYKPETWFMEMRTHTAHYIKGVRGAAKLRDRVSAAVTLEDYEKIISEL